MVGVPGRLPPRSPKLCGPKLPILSTCIRVHPHVLLQSTITRLILFRPLDDAARMTFQASNLDCSVAREGEKRGAARDWLLHSQQTTILSSCTLEVRRN